MSVLFKEDFNLLKDLPEATVFNLSQSVAPEIYKGGLNRYCELYSIFWSLINTNKQKCQKCQGAHFSKCINRYFLIELKSMNLSENDLYMITYMVTYFLDMIMNKGTDLLSAYYILSKGHDYVLSILLGIEPLPTNIKKETIEKYHGYLLSVLYYLLPDFKYKLGKQ